jgi:anti-sigma regulatory factor (Ser/Thr protein kinase)
MRRERSHFRAQEVLRVDKESLARFILAGGFPRRIGGHASISMSTAIGHLELTLDPDPTSVARARTAVLDAIPALDPERESTVRLLISELVTNALRHGDHKEPVELHASWNSKVRVEVTDHGEGFTHHPREKPLDEPGGYGLMLVGSLADRWGVENEDCTTVWFELNGT